MFKKATAKKVLNKSFVDNHENIDEDKAAQLIVLAEQKIKEVQEEKDADEKLIAAKQMVKDINSAYTSAIKYERAKISFLLEKISEIQGGEVNPSSGANL
jgi:FlaA1/EpsC-like NDP-sugar epimerase